MKRVFAILSLLALIVLAAPPLPVKAEVGEQIQSFDTNITLTNQNVAKVTETIVYDFGTNYRHGIYRDIPVTYHEGDTNYYFSLNYDKTVDESGSNVQSQISNEGDNQRIRLGNPDTTITGVHTYVISYSLQPVVYLNQGRPFFNFDVIGTGFDVPINRATATVKTDPAAPFADPVCFSGSFGGQEKCTVEQAVPGTLTTLVVGLQANQGVTLNAYLPDGYMNNYLQPNKKPPLTWSDVWATVTALAIPILVIGGIAAALVIAAIRRVKARSRRKAQTVIPQYNPPQTLTPAEVGHLSDDSSDMAEVTATIIDLARRDFIKISEQPAPSTLGKLFGKRQDYLLSKVNTPTALTPSEQTLYDGLFNDKQELLVSKLDRTKTAAVVVEFKKQVKQQLSDKGYYAAKGGVLTKGVLTDSGAQEWALVDGFKLFIDLVEKDRLDFTDAPERTPERFNHLLPYAIALGLEKKWAKQFQGIDVQQATNWYHGNNMAAFSAVSLANSLNSGFASTLATNSSISSGGGSVGGGGGGGGGGSW